MHWHTIGTHQCQSCQNVVGVWRETEPSVPIGCGRGGALIPRWSVAATGGGGDSAGGVGASGRGARWRRPGQTAAAPRVARAGWARRAGARGGGGDVAAKWPAVEQGAGAAAAEPPGAVRVDAAGRPPPAGRDSAARAAVTSPRGAAASCGDRGYDGAELRRAALRAEPISERERGPAAGRRPCAAAPPAPRRAARALAGRAPRWLRLAALATRWSAPELAGRHQVAAPLSTELKGHCVSAPGTGTCLE